MPIDRGCNPSFWANKEILLPRHNWNVHIVAVENPTACLCLNNRNPTWIRDMACNIPEANWKHKNIVYDRQSAQSWYSV